MSERNRRWIKRLFYGRGHISGWSSLCRAVALVYVRMMDAPEVEVGRPSLR